MNSKTVDDLIKTKFTFEQNGDASEAGHSGMAITFSSANAFSAIHNVGAPRIYETYFMPEALPGHGSPLRDDEQQRLDGRESGDPKHICLPDD